MAASSEPFHWHGPDTFVVFGDMLGFASLVVNDPLDTDEHRLASIHDHWLLKQEPISDPPEYTFERQYLLFNKFVGEQIDDFRPRSTSIVFSDSFFFATEDGPKLLTFAAQLISELAIHRVPVRMGIAQGSFCIHETATLDLVRRRARTIQFLGKGVVKAHHAEASGIKGIRIVLDRDVVTRLRLGPELAMPIPVRERGKGRQYELNYLFPEFIPLAKRAGRQDALVAAVREMRERHEGQAGPLRHYRRTERALNRMIRVSRTRQA